MPYFLLPALSEKNRQKPCRSYFRAPSAESAESCLFSSCDLCLHNHPIYLCLLSLLLSFCSSACSYGMPISIPKALNTDHLDDKQNTSRNGIVSGFDYFDPNCSQFPLNFPKTSPRGLGYTSTKAGEVNKNILYKVTMNTMAKMTLIVPFCRVKASSMLD